MPPLSILLKPASSACNLRCAYCFYADEAQKRQVPNYGMMSDEVVRAVLDKAFAAAEGSVSFLFQGGEPTLAGLDFYRRFTALAKAWTPSGLAVRYAIQTNGTLLDKSWCRFFAENQFLTGLSLDGNRACHDRFRTDAAGRGTYSRVVRAAQLLDQAGAQYNVLAVVTGHLAGHIRSAFAALCKSGFRYQQYIPCLDPLGAARGGAAYSLSPAQYGEFLKTLFDLWYRELERGQYYSIRYFDNLVWMLAGRPPEQCSMGGFCADQYLIEADGSVYPCDFYGLDQYRMGSVLEQSWTELDQAREAMGFVEQSRRIPEECRVCRWYGLCRNGCRRDRTLEDGVVGKNYYCTAYASFFEYALPRLRQVRNMLRPGADSS